MPLDYDIKNIIEAIVENDLPVPKVAKECVPNLKQMWK